MTKRTTLVPSIVILLCSMAACGQDADQPSVGNKIHRDIVYGHVEGLGLIYDVLQPEAQNGAGIVQVQSGGLRSTWRPPDGFLPIYADLLDAGYVVFLVYHRNAETGVDAFEDIHRSIRHIRLHAENYGIDPDRLGVTGRSSGGMVSLMMGVAGDDGDSAADDPVERTSNRVAAVVARAPPVEVPRFFEELAELQGRDRRPEFGANAEQMSPINYVDRGDPPTLLIHGDEDNTVLISHSEAMYTALRQAGVPSAFVVVPGVGHTPLLDATIERSDHGFLATDSDTGREALLDWFNQYLLPQASH
jgi:dipeptidyl aminopeptidase/acylaminoacyl peptidase